MNFSATLTTEAPGPGGRPALRWALAATLLAGTACSLFDGTSATAKASAAAPTLAPRQATTAVVDPAIAGRFSRFAVNALLVTLMDDDEPPRWSDVALGHLCGPATHVEVDGRPLVPGSRIPPTAFTVRWNMDQCRALEAYHLSGVVELLVFHDDNGMSAVVSPQSLMVSNEQGISRLSEPFSGAMSFLGTEVAIEPPWPT